MNIEKKNDSVMNTLKFWVSKTLRKPQIIIISIKKNIAHQGQFNIAHKIVRACVCVRALVCAPKKPRNLNYLITCTRFSQI